MTESVSIIGLYILAHGTRENISDVVRVRNNNEEYVPIFSDKFAAKRFIRDHSIDGFLVQINNIMHMPLINMCKEDNLTLALDIIKIEENKFSFKNILLHDA